MKEHGYTFVELIVALFVLTLLIAFIYPVLTVFKSSAVEKGTHLTGLWLAQGEMERQLDMETKSGRAEGVKAIENEGTVYLVHWERKPVNERLDLVDVNVSWYVGEKKRELLLERYVRSK